MAKQILLIYYEIVKFTCMKITYNLFLYFKHFSCFRARFVLLVLREVERGGSRYKLPATGPRLRGICSSYELYKHCFTNTKDSIDVELENLSSLLHNMKTVINNLQSTLNECKLVPENLEVLADFTTIRQ